MNSCVVLYLWLMTSGTFCLIASLYLTRATWREDIKPYGRRSSYFQMVMYPEKFSKPDRLGVIRVLNSIGGLLVLGAPIVLGRELYLTVVRA